VIIIDQVITDHILRMHKHIHSKELTNWECNGPQYSKWGKEKTIVIVIHEVITYHPKFNTDVQTIMSIQMQLTTWVWVNAPVHSTASWQKREMWSLSTKLSLITQNSILRMHKHVHSKELTNWDFNSPQHSKWGKNVIVIDQAITHHTKFNPEYVQTCFFKGNLPTESTMVHSTASVEGRKIVIVVNQAVTHHKKKLNPEYKQTCSFKGNLQSESATIQNTASGERKQCDHYWPSYHSSHKIQSWCMHKHVHSKATHPLSMG